MTEFSPIGHDRSSTRVRGAAKTSSIREDVSPAANASGNHVGDAGKHADRVELSDRARFIAQLQSLPDVRAERVDAARDAVNDPGYLSEDRLHEALGRMLEDVEDGFEIETIRHHALESLAQITRE